jgi:hypothetical protein
MKQPTTKKPRPEKRTGNALLEIDGLTPAAQQRIRDATQALREVIEEAMPDATFEEHEAAVLKITNEIARQELERKLQTIANELPTTMVIDHNNDWHGDRDETAFEYRREHIDHKKYHSLVGDLKVQRGVYREHGSWSRYVALDLKVGMMEGCTPALAKALAVGFGEMPTRQIAEFFAAAGRRVPSRSTLDRTARDVGAYAIAANDEIEEQIRATEVVPMSARALAIGVDRTAVAMRNNATRDAWQFVGSDVRRPRPKCPRSSDKKAKGVQWLMDYVATVTFLNDHGERLESRCYRLQSLANPDYMMKRVMADVHHALQQRPDLRICVVQDGAPELWKLVRRHLGEQAGVARWHEVLDWYHVDERLAACAQLCTDNAHLQQAQRDRWRTMLWASRGGAARLIRSLREKRQGVTHAAQAQLREHAHYFARRRSLLYYRKTKHLKLPIGSGITEGACKSFIGTRAKRSGQHWTPRGLAASLHIRGMIQSGRFDAFWAALRGRYIATSMTEVVSGT